MKTSIREQLRELTARAGSIDKALSAVNGLPDLDQAKALVELSKINDKLGKVGAMIAGGAGKPKR